MDAITFGLLVTAVSLLGILWQRMRYKLKFWEMKGVKTPSNSLPFLGHMWPVIIMKKSINEFYGDAYLEFPEEKAVGLYEMLTPTLVIVDLELIEHILIRDFHYFTDHPNIFGKGSIFSLGLFNLNGPYWKAVRGNVSSTFTAAKLKNMFQQMNECGNELAAKLGRYNGEDCEVKNYLSTYDIDLVASTVFGIEFKNTENKNKFNEMSSKILGGTKRDLIKQVMIIQYPNLTHLLGMKFVPSNVEDYFKNIVKNTLDQRETTNIHRNDYVQHLLHLKQRKIDHDEGAQLTVSNIEFTDDLLSGQAVQFLVAGHEAVCNTLMYVMYELANHPVLQERARKEIKSTLDKYSGYSYEALKEMKFLENCVQETLRVHPAAGILMRTCNEDYVTEDGLKIDKGTKIIIPLKAIQMDPRHVQNPQSFNPDRFSDEITKHSLTYLAFGKGPRICIGMYYAMMEMKLAVAKSLEKFKIEISKKTDNPLIMNRHSILGMPKSKVYLKFQHL